MHRLTRQRQKERGPSANASWRQLIALRCLLAMAFLAGLREVRAQPAISNNQGNASGVALDQTAAAQKLFPREAVPSSNSGRESSTPAQNVARTNEVSEGIKNHVLNPNDLISIKVYQEPDLDAVCRVGKDGVISFWLLGDIRIGGKTVQTANNHIRDLLKKDFLVNPQVNITILEYAKREFTILGNGVQRPGAYAMPDDKPLTLQQAIALAGGYKPGARISKVFVTRFVGGDKITARVDARNFAKDRDAKAFLVLPDDHIEIDESLF